MKRLLCFVLAILLLAPATAVRAEDPVVAVFTHWLQCGIFGGRGMVTPPEEWVGFPLTRAELTTVFIAILDRRKDGDARIDEIPFADVKDHWAAGYIAVAADEGLVKGNPDGTFRPDAMATELDLKVMTARLLRLSEPAPDTVDAALKRAGVDPTLPAVKGEGLIRSQVLLLLDRAMSVPLAARYGLPGAMPELFPSYGLWSDFIGQTGPVSRAEVTALLIVLLGRRSGADARRGEAPFTDLQRHPAAGFVAEATAQGLVKGYPDGTFRPDQPVTAPELKLMLARLLRLGNPAPDQLDAVLRAGGVDPTLAGGEGPIPAARALELLNRAMATPIYARFGQ